MGTSMTHKYIPRIEQTEENLFIEEYYSSTDTKIFMNNVEQTEISYISYQLREQLKPIYGYSSRTFDDMAVGNRLVSGVFKVPIKNPNVQTPMEDIIKHDKDNAQNNIHDDYNESQQEQMDNTDWINGENNNDNSANSQEDDTTFEYRTKLIALGYDLDYNSSSYILEQRIKEFQKDNGLYEDGKLTAETMGKIDEAILKKNSRKIPLKKGTKIYLKPMASGPHITLSEDQDVYVLDDSTYDDGWTYIMTKDGYEGYIKIEEE